MNPKVKKRIMCTRFSLLASVILLMQTSKITNGNNKKGEYKVWQK